MRAPLTLPAVEAAVRAAWSRDTCDECDAGDWSPRNPARGQCGTTALTLHDLFGGDLLLAEVHHPDGSRQGYHYWIRLPGGLEVDLTREQFDAGEQVQAPQVVVRPPGPPGRSREQYLRLRQRVYDALGLPP